MDPRNDGFCGSIMLSGDLKCLNGSAFLWWLIQYLVPLLPESCYCLPLHFGRGGLGCGTFLLFGKEAAVMAFSIVAIALLALFITILDCLERSSFAAYHRLVI